MTPVARGGVFTVAEAMAAGYTRAQIRHRVATGVWRALRRGVLVADEAARRASADPRSEHRVLTAAVLATHANTWASHESAAVGHGLEFLREPDLHVVRLTRPVDACSRLRRTAGCEIHCCGLPPAHRNDARRTTTPARTVVDLARRLPLLDAVVVADSAMRRRGVRTDDLARVLESCRGWPGSATATAAVQLADPLKVEKIRQEVLEDWGLEVVRWGMREMRRDSAGVADRVRRGFARSLVRQEIRARSGEVEVFHRLPSAPWDIPPVW